MDLDSIPDTSTILRASAKYLRETGESDAAKILEESDLDLGNFWRYSGGTSYGIAFTLRCDPESIQKLEGQEFTFGNSPSDAHEKIVKAFNLVLPVDVQVHSLEFKLRLEEKKSRKESDEISQEIEVQKSLMISVATGGPKIQEKNSEYKKRREIISLGLKTLGLKDPNPFNDLWAWYGKWSDGSMPRYQDRREYIHSLYGDLLDTLSAFDEEKPYAPDDVTTGWLKVDRVVTTAKLNLRVAKTEEEFQSIGLLCRELMISVAQAVYLPEKHKPADGTIPSRTDGYRMLEGFFNKELEGSSNEVARRHAKASLALANDLQHKRTASYKDAALCYEATRSVVNIVSILSEKKIH